jgi:hypothetical protein
MARSWCVLYRRAAAAALSRGRKPTGRVAKYVEKPRSGDTHMVSPLRGLHCEFRFDSVGWRPRLSAFAAARR